MRNNVSIYATSNPTGPSDFRQVEYKGFYFSGGEPHVELQNPDAFRGAQVLLNARVGSMNDLGMLLALTDAVKRCRAGRVDLILPYFPGARQDREEKGFALTAKVYADIINGEGYGAVFILDPHSPVAPALLDRSVVLPHAGLVAQFLEQLPPIDGLICPDAGAERRTLELAKYLNCNNVVFARKKRDPKTGALSGFSLDPLPMEGNYLLADDICDGGGTFIGLAEKFREDPASGTGLLYLWTTHGIFSKGLETLSKHFSKIGCSDSFPNALEGHPDLTTIPVLNDLSILTAIREGRR